MDEYLIEKFTQSGTEFAGVVIEPKLFKFKQALSPSKPLDHKFGVVLWGVLVEDAKDRFAIDTPIRTSEVNELFYSNEHDLTVITTRNSSYFYEGDLASEYGLRGQYLWDADQLSDLITCDALRIGYMWG